MSNTINYSCYIDITSSCWNSFRHSFFVLQCNENCRIPSTHPENSIVRTVIRHTLGHPFFSPFMLADIQQWERKYFYYHLDCMLHGFIYAIHVWTFLNPSPSFSFSRSRRTVQKPSTVLDRIHIFWFTASNSFTPLSPHPCRCTQFFHLSVLYRIF